MRVLVFRGKNWKLASESKWKDEDIDTVPEDAVGTLKIGEMVYTVYMIPDGFCAFDETRAHSIPTSWHCGVMGGNVNFTLYTDDEAEAARKFRESCEHWKSFGTMYRRTDTGLEKVMGYDGRPKRNDDV